MLLTGCQSERAAFRFAPPAHRPVAAPAAAAARALPRPARTAAAAAAAPVAPGQQLTERLPRRHELAAKHVTAPAPQQLQRQHSAKLSPRLATRAPARHPAATAAQARPAESGLGRIFFFFLGVTLVVLAGLSAGVAALAGISFWLALGLVAGGLVVLGLLYSLLGKKSPEK